MGIGPADRIAPPGLVPAIRRVERDEAASDAGGRARQEAGEESGERETPHDSVELSDAALELSDDDEAEIALVATDVSDDEVVHLDLQA